MSPITRVLVPIDFSEYTKQVMALAIDLSRRYQASLHLLHVHQPLTYTMPDDAIVLTGEQLAHIFDTLAMLLNGWKSQAEAELTTPVETSVVQGNPASEIVRQAKERSCDLIVMGTHGRTGVRHWLTGSVAERVVQTAACPVLTVHPAAASAL